MNRRNWTPQEDQQLVKIVDQIGDNDWPSVAKLLQFHCRSRSPIRTGKQCRERWYNQLNPQISKEQWTYEEEKRLFEVQKQYGNKWKQISKFLVGRTDNDIKNKFYSTLRRSLRRLNKLGGRKNSTGEIREIKPSVLAEMIKFLYSKEDEKDQMTQVFRGIPELIFKFSNCKPVRQNITNIVEQQAQTNINFIFQLLQQFKNYQSTGIIKTPLTLHKQTKQEFSFPLPTYTTATQLQESKRRVFSPIITIKPRFPLESKKEDGEKMDDWEENEIEGDITGMLVEGQKIEIGKMPVTEEQIKYDEVIKADKD